jgi:alkylation response protein AidB-like acyl-CoA dehydrogenase
VLEAAVIASEFSAAGIYAGLTNQGISMLVPTLLEVGTEAQKKQWIEKTIRGDVIWCQGYSEPGAGSDLASLQTRGVLQDGYFVVNGQKIWTSSAHYADMMFLLCRTDPDKPKHEGISYLLLSMKTPGLDVRPLRTMTGRAEFNEVFFTDVRVPDGQRLGKVGDGWKVSLTTLMNERLAVGDAPGPDFDDIFALARTLDLDDGPAIGNPAVREKLADWYVKTIGLKYTKFRTMTALSRGQTPGPEASITKLVSASKLQEISSYGIDLMGMAGGVMDGELAPMEAWFQEALLYAPGLRIAGGSDEILRNIIAERVLGMPGDIRVDKDVPFRELKSGKR